MSLHLDRGAFRSAGPPISFGRGTTPQSQSLFKALPFQGRAGNSFRGVTPTNAPQPDIFADFLVTARKRFQMCAEAEQPIRIESLDDLQMYLGNQWSDEIKERRGKDRPCLTINRFPQTIQQVTNQQRQSRPAMQVNPVGDRADVETAKILQGLLRHIETNSMADIAYDTAFEYAAVMGFGYWRIRTDFIDSTTMDQDIYIDRIEDPFSVYFDPTAREADRSDAAYCFIVQDYTPDRYADEFPGAQMVSLADFRSVGDQERWWNGQTKIRVAEYYWIEETKKTLVALTDGRVLNEDDLEDDDEIAIRDGKPMMRMANTRKCMYSKMSALEKLEEKRIPGEWIPIIPIFGREVFVDGQRHVIGIVRDAKDAQRRYNYQASCITEVLALAPRAPWLVAEGQIEGYEQLYQQANVRPIAVLPYRQVDLAGKPAPPPQRQIVEPPIQAMTLALNQSENDFKSTTGIWDQTLGEPKSPDESGKAILARQKQGEVANFNLGDNFTRSMRHQGRVLLSMIPEIFDTARVQRIVWPDQTHEMLLLNEPFESEGMMKLYDMRTGRYDVNITNGQSYHSRRHEFVESVMALVQAAPEVMSVVLDLLVKNMDWPGAQEISERLHKMLPAQLQDGKDGDQPPVPPQVQAQIQQLMQQNALLQQHLNKASDTISKDLISVESRERIANETNRTRIQVAETTAKSVAMNQQAQRDHDALQAELDRRDALLHSQLSVEQDAEQDAFQHRADAASQESSQQHEQNLAQSAQGHEAGLASGQAQADQQSQQAAQQHEQALSQQKTAADAESQNADRQHEIRQQKTEQSAEQKLAQAKLDAGAKQQQSTQSSAATQADKQRQHEAAQARLAAKNKPAPAKKK